MFIDDLIFFSRANLWEIGAVKGILDTYAMWLGWKVNVQKSSIAFSENTFAVMQANLCEEIGQKKMRLGSKYLGLLLIMRGFKMQAFQGLQEKFFQKLAGWKS